MKTLKLEVGKTYRNRKGEEVKITGCDGGYYQPYKGTNGCWYTESGNWWWDKEHPEDLIEEVKEVPETRYTFTIPDEVKEVTIEQVGNRTISTMMPEEVELNPKTMQVEDVPKIDHIREWVEKYLNCRYYSHEGLTKVIYDYLKYREGER